VSNAQEIKQVALLLLRKKKAYISMTMHAWNHIIEMQRSP